jgi:hypothetical protein
LKLAAFPFTVITKLIARHGERSAAMSKAFPSWRAKRGHPSLRRAVMDCRAALAVTENTLAVMRNTLAVTGNLLANRT